MSDPVATTEIKDVLSSIRQLITDSSASKAQAKPAVGKLLLSPAFRVHDDGPSTLAKDVPPQPVLELVDSSIENDKTGSHATDEGAAVTADPVSIAPNPQTLAIEAPTIEGINAQQPVFAHRDYAPQIDAQAVKHPDALNGTPQTPHQSPHQAEEIENAVGQNSDAWEPDGGEEAPSSDILQFHASRNESLSQAAPSSSEIVSDDTQLIDEDILQDMVARLLREELQGDVGEKITHAIRRFVRQEVERSLTLKGLE